MIDKVKHNLKNLKFLYRAIYGVYIYFQYIRRRVSLYLRRERKDSYGPENPDKIFYVIGVPHSTGGLFAIVKSVFCHICYAVERGYIPVVDMQNFKSQLYDSTSGVNAWELYFEQPCGYSLEDIRKSKNIIHSASIPYPSGIEIGFDTKIDKNFHEKFHSAWDKYIRPNSLVKTYAEKKYSEIIRNPKLILGVLCRGTDYNASRPKWHPIQPTKEQAAAKVKSMLEKEGYEYVFLTTEDLEYFNYFKQTFGEKLLFSGQRLYDGMNGKRFLSEINVNDYSEKWQNTVDYFSSVYILSKCDGIVTGLTCGSICSILMSQGYRHQYIWDLGRY